MAIISATWKQLAGSDKDIVTNVIMSARANLAVTRQQNAKDFSNVIVNQITSE